MKYSDMNQYITLLFSLLAEFFATENPTRWRGRQAPAFARVPQRGAGFGAGFSRFSRLEAGDRSSGAPAPERFKSEAASSTVARGPVPRERSREKHLFRSFRSCMSIVTLDEETKVL